jgi:hypothetical protein
MGPSLDRRVVQRRSTVQHLAKCALERPFLVTAGVLFALGLYSYIRCCVQTEDDEASLFCDRHAEEEEEEEEEEGVEGGEEGDFIDAEAVAEPRAERRTSFTITNEFGEDRGCLDDHATQGWGWQMNAAPLSSCSSKMASPALRRNDSSGTTASESSEGAGEKPRTKPRVKFQLDRGSGFYGFVFSYDGVCVSHGENSEFVGLTLSAVLERTDNRKVNGESLHARFVAASEAGGGWISYEWRNTPSAPLRLKGAYIIKARKWERDFYAGVGYSVMPLTGAIPAASPRLGPTGPGAAPAADPRDAPPPLRLAASVPPSRMAARAAVAGLERQLRQVGSELEGEPPYATVAREIVAIIEDRRGVLAAEAAEAIRLPDELKAKLRDHTIDHIKAHDPSLSRPTVSPSVAALVGYDRRQIATGQLDPSVAALVGYHRSRRKRVRLDWRDGGADPGAKGADAEPGGSTRGTRPSLRLQRETGGEPASCLLM